MTQQPELNYAEREIQAFAGGADPEQQAQWLVEHHMLDAVTTPYEVSADTNWVRPGAETYILQFSILTPRTQARFIAKACIKVPVAECLQEWLDRRHLLADLGVATPQLHAVGRGTIIEEYIPYDLPTAYQRSTPPQRTQLRAAYTDTYQRVWNSGFRPISLHDARSRGSDVLLVDFGSDLGGRQAQDTPSATPEDAYTKAQSSLEQLLGASFAE